MNLLAEGVAQIAECGSLGASRDGSIFGSVVVVLCAESVVIFVDLAGWRKSVSHGSLALAAVVEE